MILRMMRTFLISLIVVATVCLLLIESRGSIGSADHRNSGEPTAGSF